MVSNVVPPKSSTNKYSVLPIEPCETERESLLSEGYEVLDARPMIQRAIKIEGRVYDMRELAQMAEQERVGMETPLRSVPQVSGPEKQIHILCHEKGKEVSAPTEPKAHRSTPTTRKDLESPNSSEMLKPKSRRWLNTIDPWTVEWMQRVVQTKETSRIKSHLRSFVHDSRMSEIDDELIHWLKSSSSSEAHLVLRELQNKPKFIRREKRSVQAFELKAEILTGDGQQQCLTALLDSGCTGSAIDQKFIEKHRLPVHKLPRPVQVYNADGSLNKSGSIKEFVIAELTIQGHWKQIALAVTTLSTHQIFLGHDWLIKHNPNVDWKENTLKFHCEHDHLPELATVNDDDDDEIFAVRNVATDLAAAHAKKEMTFEEMVPSMYHDYRDVFSKEEFDALPPRKPWDHAIDLIPGTHKVDCKTYNLTPKEQEELEAFIAENLKSG
jgi:hypothetical protein